MPPLAPNPLQRYIPSTADLARLERCHTFHPVIPELEQARRYEHIRALAKEVGKELLGMCPPSRELSLALTHLEEVVYWANASIARNEQLPPNPAAVSSGEEAPKSS